MLRSIYWAPLFGMMTVSCATAPGARPGDMSAADHEREAQSHQAAGASHSEQFQPGASEERDRCTPRGEKPTADGACWTSLSNPTTQHRQAAAAHRRQAEDHRAAAAALRNAEAQACGGVSPDDRDMSPFEHVEDITAVEPLVEKDGTSKAPTQRNVGAIVTFRAVPGMTAEWLQHVVDCHLARNASLGNVVPEMPNCPLVPKGAEARVSSTGNGFAVSIRSADTSAAPDILARAQRLRQGSANATPAK